MENPANFQADPSKDLKQKQKKFLFIAIAFQATDVLGTSC